MKQYLFLIIILGLKLAIHAQVNGDTIVIKTFHYASQNRDTLIEFPNANQSFEKIIMRYSMRCKNAMVSNSSQRNLGCGEWDYSCNTFITDSSRIETQIAKHPNLSIINYPGIIFDYVNTAPYNYYSFKQNKVSYSINSESSYPVGKSTSVINNLMDASQKSGKTQILYTVQELLDAGLSSGPIHGLMLNVSNDGSHANFFRLSLKHTSLNQLNNSKPDTNNFTLVCNQNINFIKGSNRIQFFTPFMWDGKSNILIEYSYTNSSGGHNIELDGEQTSGTMAIYANNNYALDLSNEGHSYLNPSPLSNISNELTITFWAYGYNHLMPANTSILYSTPTNPNHRSLNIHLPWSDGSVYFDCGVNDNGNYDRLNKATVPSNRAGQWNHWAFTKNASTGSMRIYLNGSLWALVTGKTNQITLINLLLGKDNLLNNNYKGKINELAIWNKELSASEILTYYNVGISSNHPLYNQLIAYYKMDESTGNMIHDVKNNLSSECVNCSWTYDRGSNLIYGFKSSTQRPALKFLRGTYSLSNIVETRVDSLQATPYIFQQYKVISHQGEVPFKSDEVVLERKFTTYLAVSKVYNGDNGALIMENPLTPDDTYVIEDLEYIIRNPYYVELLSFVTPYGIGLDFGQSGKTWYFDMSDYAPVLTGSRRILMALGGERQEEMQVDFLFIVGTPPRNVIEFNPLWQSINAASIFSINTNSRFPPLKVQLPDNAQSFKVRSTITGHGSEGEFSQNGGVIQHSLNLNGGSPEFTWPITQRCAFNPIFPQGGTWVYDRQGWCPGQASLSKESDITPFVKAGTTATIDYNCSSPSVASGDYRYIAAHHLICYGPANKSLDARINDVITPSNKVLYSRINPVCANPEITIQNTGSDPIQSMELEYWLNNDNSNKQNFKWTGSLNYMNSINVKLPDGNLWQNVIPSQANVFHVIISKVNGTIDQYSFNNSYHSSFQSTDILPNSIVVEFKTNNFPSQNTYKILDQNGVTISGGSNLIDVNKIYLDAYNLKNGCYKLIVTDQAEDGLQWWASTGQGSGYVRIKNSSGIVIKTFLADFGGGFEYSFSTSSTVSTTDPDLDSGVMVYPNPSHGQIFITGEGIDLATIQLEDMMGRKIKSKMSIVTNKCTIDAGKIQSGIYTVNISIGSRKVQKRIIIL